MTNSTKYHGVFLDAGSLGPDVELEGLQDPLYSFDLYDHTPAELVTERIAGAHVVIANKTPLSAEVLSHAPALKLIVIAATGTNHCDLQAAKALGVRVSNCQDYGTASVAQHVFALLLALMGRLPSYLEGVGNRDWSKSKQFCLLDYPMSELAGKVMVILGYGQIGQKVASLGRAFDMEVVIAERLGEQNLRPGRMGFEKALRQADVLSLHCPLTPETSNLINKQTLSLMKSSAILINTARGGLVDEAALVEALLNKSLAGAGLDCLSSEPPPVDHPLLVLDSPRLLITPHCAWGAIESRRRLVAQLKENILGFFAGHDIRIVV